MAEMPNLSFQQELSQQHAIGHVFDDGAISGTVLDQPQLLAPQFHARLRLEKSEFIDQTNDNPWSLRILTKNLSKGVLSPSKTLLFG